MSHTVPRYWVERFNKEWVGFAYNQKRIELLNTFVKYGITYESSRHALVAAKKLWEQECKPRPSPERTR